MSLYMNIFYEKRWKRAWSQLEQTDGKSEKQAKPPHAMALRVGGCARWDLASLGKSSSHAPRRGERKTCLFLSQRDSSLFGVCRARLSAETRERAEA